MEDIPFIGPSEEDYQMKVKRAMNHSMARPFLTYKIFR